MNEKQGFLQVKEAADLLGVSQNTIRNWGAMGKIKEYRHPVNNYRLFRRTELLRILDQLEHSAARVKA